MCCFIGQNKGIEVKSLVFSVACLSKQNDSLETNINVKSLPPNAGIERKDMLFKVGSYIFGEWVDVQSYVHLLGSKSS